MLDLPTITAAIDANEAEHLGKLRWSTDTGMYTGLRAAKLMQAMNADLRQRIYKLNEAETGQPAPVNPDNRRESATSAGDVSPSP